MKAKISKVIVTSHIACSDNSVRHSYEVHYESGVIREFFDCNVSKNVVSFLDKATLIDSSFIPDLVYNRLIESYRVTESHHYWFSCESMVDSPCNDCIGTLEDAVKVAQECANEINEPVYVNDTMDNDNIVDVVYPDSYLDTEEPTQQLEQETAETEFINYLLDNPEEYFCDDVAHEFLDAYFEEQNEECVFDEYHCKGCNCYSDCRYNEDCAESESDDDDVFLTPIIIASNKELKLFGYKQGKNRYRTP